jgi:hypothetical protein
LIDSFKIPCYGGDIANRRSKIHDYVGRDPQGRKLFIPYAQSSHSGKTIQCKNKGYIYRLTGIGNSLADPKAGGIDPEDSTDYRQVSLKAIEPNGRVILSQILNNPYYGRT